MKYVIDIWIISIIFLIVSQIQFVFYKADILNLMISLLIFYRFFKVKNKKSEKTIEINIG